MKKKLFGIMLVFAVVLFAGYTAYNSHGDIKLSDVTLANLEALAGENDGGGDRKSTRLNSSHSGQSRMPSSA